LRHERLAFNKGAIGVIQIDKEEIGPRMLARIAERTGLKPEDL